MSFEAMAGLLACLLALGACASNGECTRHSDCYVGEVCSPVGLCSVSPSDGGVDGLGVVDGGTSTDSSPADAGRLVHTDALFSTLPETTDARASDADTSDADTSDAGASDADIPDANGADALIPDAHVPDAHVPDAAIPDAGPPPIFGDALKGALP